MSCSYKRCQVSGIQSHISFVLVLFNCIIYLFQRKELCAYLQKNNIEKSNTLWHMWLYQSSSYENCLCFFLLFRQNYFWIDQSGITHNQGIPQLWYLPNGMEMEWKINFICHSEIYFLVCRIKLPPQTLHRYPMILINPF